MAINEYDDMLEKQAAATAPDSPGVGYDSMLNQEQESQKAGLKQSMFVAAQTDPDRHAKVIEISNKTNIPADIVDRNYDTLSKKADMYGTDYDQIVERSPLVAGWLQDPSNASVSRDDIQNLQGIENTVQQHSAASKAYAALNAGLASLYSGLARLPDYVYDLAAIPQNLAADYLDKPELRTTSKQFGQALGVENGVAKYYEDAGDQFRAEVPELSQNVFTEIKNGNYKAAGAEFFYQFVANFPQQAALMAAYYAAGPAVSLVGAGATTAASKNQQISVENPGIDPAVQTLNATTTGVIEAGFENIGTFGILHAWENVIAKHFGKQISKQVVLDFGKTMAAATAGEGIEEYSTSVAQDFTDYITGTNPDALKGIFERAAGAGLVGAGSGGVMTFGSSAIGTAIGRNAELRKIQLRRDFYLSMGKSAEATKLRERLPEKLRSVVEAIVKDSPVENVYISPEAMETFFQSANESHLKVMQELGVLESYNEAKELGTDVKIPMAKWVEKFVGTEYYQGLADDVKFSPGAQSVNEAKAETQKTQESLSQITDQAVAEQEQDTSNKVNEAVADKLIAAGYDQATARQYADLYGSVFRSLGERTGIDPFQLFNQYGLKINGPEVNSQVNSPQFDPMDSLLDRIRSGDLPVEDKGQSLVEFVKSKGGVTEEGKGADILAMDANKAPGKKIVSKKGISIDEMTMLAQEAGYIQSGDVNDFLTAIDSELRGNPQYTQAATANAGNPTSLSMLQEQLKKQNIDLSKMTNAEAKAVLQSGGSVAVDPESVFLQPGDEGPRGRIRFGENRQFNIDILKNADLSTFLHESGHFYLEVMGDIATSENAPEQIKQDYQAILEWLGVESRDKIGTDQHEQFARGFEAYLMEGKAPSQGLREAFARFRAWLVSVYRQLTRLNVNLSPEVRDIFGRLVASDAEIEDAKRSQNSVPLFPDPVAAGMGDKGAERYRQAQAEAQMAAEEELAAKVMADVNRTRKAEWKAERDNVKAQVTAELNARPEYIALSVLQKGTMPDGSPLPNGQEPFKLSRQGIIDSYGAERLKSLPKPYVYSKEGGVHPDVAASVLGYESGDALLTAISRAEKKEAAINRITDARMIEKHGDLVRDGELPVKAMEAIHNQKKAELLRMELQHLASNNLPVLKDVIRKVTRRVPTEEMVRKEAERVIGSRVVSEISPIAFQRAEAKAAKEAGEFVAKGDIDAAFDAKRRELMNHELYRAAVDAREAVDKAVDSFKKIARSDEKLSKTRDIDMVNTARAILSQFGIGRFDKPPMSYIEKIKQYDPDTYETVRAMIESSIQTVGNYKKISYDDFISMRDAVDAIWDLSRTNKQIEIDGRIIDRDEVKAELSSQLEHVSTAKLKDEYDRATGKWDKVKAGLLGVRASMRRAEHWFSAVDSDQSIGPFRKYIWTPVREAIDHYRSVKKDFVGKYLALVKELEPHLSKQNIVSPELKYIFNGKQELLAALLHTGNESNLSKLLRGLNWGQFNEDGTLNTSRWDQFIERMKREGVLTKADYDFVQKVWDLNESMKAGAQQAHKKMYGYYFNEITHKEFTNQFGTYKGGYVPASIDSTKSDDASARSDKEALEKTNNTFMFPTTGRGFTKSRVPQAAAPLALDLTLVASHIDKVLRFTHIEPVIKQSGRLINDREFKKTLTNFDPAIVSDMLIPWLQRSAQQLIQTPSQGKGGKFLDTMARYLRTATGLQMMTFNAVNVLQNTAGLSLSLLKGNKEYLGPSMWRYMRSPKQVSADIAEKSQFMKNNMEMSAAEMMKTVEGIVEKPSKLDTVREHMTEVGYFFQKAVQDTIDKVVWGSAYDQAIANGETDQDAVRLADSAVRETQGSFQAEDISRIETGSAFARLFTQFYSYFNMQANLLGSEVFKAQQIIDPSKRRARLLYVYTFGFMATAVVSEMIARLMGGDGPFGGDDDGDENGFVYGLASLFFGSQFRQATAMVPGVGKFIDLAGKQTSKALFGSKSFGGYDDRLSTSPAISALESAGGAFSSVPAALFGDGNSRKAIKDSLTLLGIITKMPLAPIAKPLGYAADISAGRVQPTGPIDTVRGLVTGRPGKKQ